MSEVGNAFLTCLLGFPEGLSFAKNVMQAMRDTNDFLKRREKNFRARIRDLIHGLDDAFETLSIIEQDAVRPIYQQGTDAMRAAIKRAW